LQTLEDLYVDVLKDLYDAEGQILKALLKDGKGSQLA
jgi:ferritin-like metal-binding protein YciE